MDPEDLIGAGENPVGLEEWIGDPWWKEGTEIGDECWIGMADLEG